jgi:hypothetical protein
MLLRDGRIASSFLTSVSMALTVIPSHPPVKRIRSARCRPFSSGAHAVLCVTRGGLLAHHLSVFTSHVRCRRRPEKPAAATACFVTTAACSRLGPAGATDPVLRVSQV